MPDPTQRPPSDPDNVHTGPQSVDVALVAIGGALGTALRAVLSATVPDLAGFPLGIFLINLVGAFGLGLVLELLTRRGPDTGRRRRLRLTAGTGLIGGFTTYSALAVGVAQLLDRGHLALATAYALGSVLIGAASTFLGVITARHAARGTSTA